MDVRALVEGDRNEMLRLLRAMYPDVDPVIEFDELTTQRPGTGVFVIARDDSALGGYVEIGTRAYAEGCDSSPVAYVEAWYVDDDLRRQGWGSKLFAAAEKWARSHGLTEIASDVRIDNPPSIAAHLALGYIEVERIACFAKRL